MPYLFLGCLGDARLFVEFGFLKMSKLIAVSDCFLVVEYFVLNTEMMGFDESDNSLIAMMFFVLWEHLR